MEHLDITPHVPGVVRFARQVLKESPADSQSADAARKILRECGVEPDEN